VSVERGAIHGVSFLTRVWPPAREWQEAAARAVREASDRVVGEDRAGEGIAQ